METKLRKWLTKHGVTHRKFCYKLDITEATLYNLLNQKHMPGLELAFKIDDATKGAVTPRDFYNEFKTLPKKGNKGSTPKVSGGAKKGAVLARNRRR